MFCGFGESYVVGVIQECDCVDNLIFRVVLMCTFIDVFKLWSEDKPVRGQSFALPGGAFKQNPRPCSVSPHFEFCQSSVRGPLPHIPIIFVADMVAEERRCRGTAMSDTVGMPTRHHGQPNHQLSLALTLPPPLYRGMPTTQPQSTCVRARLPHAREFPTREKGKIGSGPWFPLGFSIINKCLFLPQALGDHTHQQWRQAGCGPEANNGRPSAQARGRATCGPKACKPWRQAFCGP